MPLRRGGGDDDKLYSNMLTFREFETSTRLDRKATSAPRGFTIEELHHGEGELLLPARQAYAQDLLVRPSIQPRVQSAARLGGISAAWNGLHRLRAQRQPGPQPRRLEEDLAGKTMPARLPPRRQVEEALEAIGFARRGRGFRLCCQRQAMERQRRHLGDEARRRRRSNLVIHHQIG